MIVITGVSGSGKSSLAFDTIYAEGRWIYVETFSSYARQFLDRSRWPKVDKIEGMLPAIAIDQTNPVRTSRSTVGTMTELNDGVKTSLCTSFISCMQGVWKESTKDLGVNIFHKLWKKKIMRKWFTLLLKIAIPDNFGKDEVKQLLQSQGYSHIFREFKRNRSEFEDEDYDTAENESGYSKILKLHCIWARALLHFTQETKRKRLYIPRDCIVLIAIFTIDHFRVRTFFNSPIGACDACRGFGRIIGVDYNLVIPELVESRLVAL